MNGLINWTFPLFQTIDSVVSSLGPGLGLRVIAWGGAAGVAAMFLYRGLSNQNRIRSIKRDVAEFRRQLSAAGDDDLSEVLRLSRANLKVSFSLLGAVILPSLVSTLPVLLVVAWLYQDYGYDTAPAADTIVVGIFPPDAGARFSAPGRVRQLSAAEYEVELGGSAVDVMVGDRSSPERYPIPSNPAAPVLEKHSWWNALLSNPAGYLEPDSPLDRIEYGYQRRVVFGALPGWMSTWEFPFFTALLVASLGLKFGLRIE